MFKSYGQQLLDRAFEALEAQGIIARPNFLCCNSCACDAMTTEKERWTGATAVIGAVHFNEQSTESANEGGALFLGHGSFAGDEQTNLQIGLAVCSALREAGLKVSWNHDTTKRIVVEPPPGITWDLRYPRNTDYDD
jgi:hypothetical protein